MTFFVLGSEDVVIGFQFIGVSGIVVSSREETLTEFKKAIAGEYGEMGILLITEKAAVLIEEELMQWQLEGDYPLIVEIPDLEGHIDGKKTMLESIREAIGLSV